MNPALSPTELPCHPSNTNELWTYDFLYISFVRKFVRKLAINHLLLIYHGSLDLSIYHLLKYLFTSFVLKIYFIKNNSIKWTTSSHFIYSFKIETLVISKQLQKIFSVNNIIYRIISSFPNSKSTNFNKFKIYLLLIKYEGES